MHAAKRPAVTPASTGWFLVVAGPCRATANVARYRQGLAEALHEAVELAGAERTVLVGLEAERPWWAPIAARFGVQRIIEQPFDRGSATGVLLALKEIDSDVSWEHVTIRHVAPGQRTTRHRATRSELADRFSVACPSLFAEVSHGADDLDAIYPFLPVTELSQVLAVVEQPLRA